MKPSSEHQNGKVKRLDLLEGPGLEEVEEVHVAEAGGTLAPRRLRTEPGPVNDSDALQVKLLTMAMSGKVNRNISELRSQTPETGPPGKAEGVSLKLLAAMETVMEECRPEMMRKNTRFSRHSPAPNTPLQGPSPSNWIQGHPRIMARLNLGRRLEAHPHLGNLDMANQHEGSLVHSADALHFKCGCRNRHS